MSDHDEDSASEISVNSDGTEIIDYEGEIDDAVPQPPVVDQERRNRRIELQQQLADLNQRLDALMVVAREQQRLRDLPLPMVDQDINNIPRLWREEIAPHPEEQLPPQERVVYRIPMIGARRQDPIFPLSALLALPNPYRRSADEFKEREQKEEPMDMDIPDTPPSPRSRSPPRPPRRPDFNFAYRRW